jgi:hypothetical protein
VASPRILDVMEQDIVKKPKIKKERTEVMKRKDRE